MNSLLNDNGMTSPGGREDHGRAIAVLVADTKSRARGDLLQIQARGLQEVGDDQDFVFDHTEVSLDGTVHAEAVLYVLVDAVRLIGRVAFGFRGDDTELELLEHLVSSGDAADHDVVIALLGDDAVEVHTPDPEGLVLLDGAVVDALVVATVVCCE